MCGITAVDVLKDGFIFGTFLVSSGFCGLFGILEGKRFGSAAEVAVLELFAGCFGFRSRI